jgi:hypothetical protein
MLIFFLIKILYRIIILFRTEPLLAAQYLLMYVFFLFVLSLPWTHTYVSEFYSYATTGIRTALFTKIPSLISMFLKKRIFKMKPYNYFNYRKNPTLNWVERFRLFAKLNEGFPRMDKPNYFPCRCAWKINWWHLNDTAKKVKR